MKNFASCLYLVSCILFFAGAAYAGALDITKIGMGARTLALGRAQVAGRDVASTFVNPANSAELTKVAVTSMYTNLAEDTAYTMGGVIFPLREGDYGCFGVGYLGAQVTGIALTTSETRSAATSTVDYNNRLFILSYARRINSFVNMGSSLKFATKSLETVANGSATGLDLDMGFTFYPKDNLMFGLSFQDILTTGLSWNSGAKEDFPTNIKMGINANPRDNLSILLDYDSSRNIHFGVEWLVKKILFLRGGAESVPTGSSDSVTNYSLGVGLALKGLNFDYAYYIDTLLSSNSSHFFSISYVLPDKILESRPILPASVPTPNPFN